MSTDAAIADHRLHPGTIAIRFLKESPRTLIGLPAVLALMSDVGWGLIALLAMLSVIILGFMQWLAWSRFRYGLGASEIVIESGLLSRNRRSIPFERIQDLDIERGPLHRLFGLAKVKIETGAGGKDEGVLDSLTLAEADRLRAAIRVGRQTVAARENVPLAPAPEPDSRTIFAMRPSRVLASGLFNFSLAFIAGIFAILQSVGELLPIDIWDWLKTVDQTYADRLTPGAILAVLLLAVLLGVVAGVLRTLSRDWGFRLLDEGKRLRRKRGLFTRTEIVVPKRRVQLALVRTGPFRERLGFAELLLQTLGSNGGEGGLQSVAPFARGVEIDAVVAALPSLQLPGATPLEQVSGRSILRTAIRITLLPLVAILAGAFWQPGLLLLLLLLPLLLGGAVLQRRYHRFGVAGAFLFVQAGFWGRRTWALPIANAQTVRLSRSFLQRRLGLATLAIDTAGAPLLAGTRIVDLRVEPARALRDDILETLRRARVH